MIAKKLGGTSGGTADKPMKPTAQAAGTYTVKSGDTLSRIAAAWKLWFPPTRRAEPELFHKALIKC